MFKKVSLVVIIIFLFPIFGAHAKNNISFEKFDEISKKENVVLIDIRTPEEFKEGHIAGALNIDYYESDFSENVFKLDKNKEYIIYCRSGRRSNNAYPLFEEANLVTYDFTPGIIGWKEAGRELVTD